MEKIQYILIGSGILLVLIGIFFGIFQKLGLGNLPGDFKYESENTKIYFPLMTSLLISAILSLAFFIINKLK